MGKVNAAVAALDTKYGPAWQSQFKEERRVDPVIEEVCTRFEPYRVYSKAIEK